MVLIIKLGVLCLPDLYICGMVDTGLPCYCIAAYAD